MANTLRFKRGLVSTIPTAALGEPLFTTDTFDLYIGNGTGNTRFQKYIASGATTQILRGDGSLYTFPLNISSPTNGQVLKYDGTNWVNGTDSGITGSGSAGQVAYFTGATTQGGSNNLFWDATNNRLGIGNLAPTTILQLSQSSAGNPIGLFVTNSGASTLNNSSDIWFGNWVGASVSNIYNARISALNTNAITAATSLLFYTYNGSGSSAGVLERMRLDANGNLGLGVTPSASWVTGAKIMQIGSNGAIYNNNVNVSALTHNAVLGNSTDNYILASQASLYAQINGKHEWRYAPTGTIGGTITWSTPMTLTANGRLLLGTTIEGTQRLQVSGDTLMVGSGNTSASTALTVQNSSGNLLLSISNAGGLSFRTDRLTSIIPTNDQFNLATNGNSLRFTSNLLNTATYGYNFINANGQVTWTSGTGGSMYLFTGYAPTSGTGIYNTFIIQNSINQTGGANGITRGLYVNPTLTAAADWRSIETSNNTGWSFYGAGSANSYFGGSVGIGTTSLTGYNLRVSKNITGALASFGVSVDAQIQSDATSSINIFHSLPSTQAAAFNIGSLIHYFANQGTQGASSTITNQYGFLAQAGLTGATNNYGFYGNIASGTGRWNLYMNGTASNYFNGNVLLGSTTDSGEKLQVTGTMKVTGASTFGGSVTAGGNLLLTAGTASSVGAINLLRTGTSPVASRLTFGTDGTGYSFAIGKNQSGTITDLLTILDSGAATFSSSVTGASFIPSGSSVPTNGMYLSAANTLNFATNSGNRLSISSTGLVTFTDSARFPNLKGCVFTQTGGSLFGSISMDSGNAITIDNNGFFGLSVASNYTMTGGNLGIGHGQFGTSATKTISVNNGTAPTSSPTDTFQMYSNDVTAGNAAPHFRTENGAVIKLYQQDNSVAAANFVAGIGTSVTTLDAFDGYTIGQVVKALRNAGILS